MSGNDGRYRIVILGGGTAGWMSAAGLRKLLPERDYALTLVESDEIGTVGVGEATLPHIKLFNDMLGLAEPSFMRATRATFKLGIEFVGWDRPGTAYLHPFGAYGEPWGGVQFQHHWLRLRAAGRDPGAIDLYSYAVSAARAHAFDHPDEDQASVRSTYSYAYHFDAGLYAQLLRGWATERGVERIEGRVARVEQDTRGDVAALHLASGERIEGDLFVDCSGFRSLLLGGTLEVGWQDWMRWLPCDRALALPCTRREPLLPFTRATAQDAGWTWRIPLQHRTGNGYVFASALTDEERATETLLASLDGDPLGEPRLLRFAPGRREIAWAKNCVAIGLASGFLEPLESTSIYLVQAAVTDLATYLPKARGPVDPRLAAEFNRLFALQYERVRDFLVLHYAANRRKNQALWDHVRHEPLPDSLRHKIDLFRARGTAPDYQYGLFARDSWLAVLIGQGILPRHHERLADAIPIDAIEQRMGDFGRRIAGGVARMPSHAEFVAGYCDAGLPLEAAA